MTISIPDEVLQKTNLTASQIKLELAIYLYDKQGLSLGKARRIAGVSLIEFQRALAERGVYLRMDSTDLDKELQNLSLL
jgi:predicted HTH domain antitoxin